MDLTESAAPNPGGTNHAQDPAPGRPLAEAPPAAARATQPGSGDPRPRDARGWLLPTNGARIPIPADRLARWARTRARKALLAGLAPVHGGQAPKPTAEQLRLADSILDLDALLEEARARAAGRSLNRRGGLSDAGRLVLRLSEQRAELLEQLRRSARGGRR